MEQDNKEIEQRNRSNSHITVLASMFIITGTISAVIAVWRDNTPAVIAWASAVAWAFLVVLLQKRIYERDIFIDKIYAELLRLAKKVTECKQEDNEKIDEK